MMKTHEIPAHHSAHVSQLRYYRFYFTLTIFAGILASNSVYSANTDSGSPIKISGVAEEIQKNIERHLGVENGHIPYSAFGFPRSDRYILNKTRTALQATGFYQPRIKLSGSHQQWQLDITAGSPVEWQNVDIQIVKQDELIEPLRKLIENHPFKSGHILNHGEYDQFKKQLLTQAVELGFLNASFETSRMEVNPDALTASLKWRFNLYERFRINQINISGSELSYPFLQRYLYVFKDQFYLHQNIIKTQQAMNRSGYFNSVTIEREVDQQSKLVNLTIESNDIKKYEFKTTLGYGTDSGGKIGASLHDRRINDKGHQYIVSFDISEIESTSSFQYKIPLKGKQNEWFNRYSYRQKDDLLASSTISTIESRVLWRHSDHWSSQTTLALSDESVTSKADIASSLQYLIPSWQLNYYSVTDPFKAQSGWRWENRIRVSDNSLSRPDIRFIQLEQRLKSIWKLSDHWRFLLRTRAAHTRMNNDQFIQVMPTTYRYFAGGDVSVRGYDYQTLSPKNEDGVVLGGKHLFTYSLEFDWQFKDDWRWAFFTDAGNAFNSWQNITLKKSVGTGIRWVTPVGSIRIDFARALDDMKDWRWHITIGPDL